MIKTIAEKNLNKYSLPIYPIKGRPIEKYPVGAKWNNNIFIVEQGSWSPKNLMIMDILGTIIVHSSYNGSMGDGPDLQKRIPTMKDNRPQYIHYH